MFEHSPVGMAYVGLDGSWLEVNQRLCELTGYTREELLALGWQKITHPDDLACDLAALAKLASGEIDNHFIEKRYIRKDGRAFWARIAVSSARQDPDQNPLHFTTVVEDITAYKRAQELRMKAEEKCSIAFRQTPLAVMVTSAIDHRYLEVNDAFLRVSGFTREEVIGRTPFDLNLWQDPARRYEVVAAVLAGQRIEGRESVFQRKDGSTFTALYFADAIAIDGEPCMIGAALDITDRKRLESELQELGGRLIKAQDEERRRIATELSDSLGQAATVVNYEMSQLIRRAQGELVPELRALLPKIQDITAGIGILSQTIHPSGLDYTGLPWALEGLCRQFTHVHGLQIAFKHEGVPSSLPPDIALCLYRVVQEGLTNVVRHSGTNEAWIELVSDGNTIRLELRDKGVGFAATFANGGLGFLTMRERCRRLNGSVVIDGAQGTRIEVRVPLPGTEASLFDAEPDEQRPA